MIFGAAALKQISSVLTQEELLLLERTLESLPAAYDYCSVMTDDQLNHLIEFLSRQKENIFLELNHVKSERDACVAERDEYKKKYEESEEELKAKIAEKERELAEKERELTDKDRIIKSKNKQIEKKSKKIMDLQERLDDANENRYGDKQQRSRSKKSDDKKEHESKKDDKGQNNTRSTNNPDTDDVDRTRQEEECDGTTPQDPIIESKSDKSVKSSAMGMTFKPENRPEAYNTMKLCGLFDIKISGMETRHQFDRSQLPPGSIIKASRIEKFFTMKTVLVCETCEKLKVKLPGAKSAKWMYIPMPGQESRRPVPGTKASSELLQAIAYDHYVKRVSINNIRKYLKDIGLQVSRNTLSNWLQKGKKKLDAVIVHLKERALEKDSIINCDETWCKVRRFNKFTKKYIWVLVNRSQKIVIFFYDEGSRGRKVLTDFLGDAELEAIMTDGYNAYNFLDGKLSIDHLHCMAHSRAKFIKAYKLGSDLLAKEIVELFDELYKMERRYKQSGFSPQQIYEARQSPETEVIVRKLYSIVSRELSKPSSDRSYYMQEALNYFDHFKQGLFLYRTNGNYPIDNNIAERQVRPFAAMRKVIEHFGSDEGAEKMSSYLSIVSTVLMSGASVWRFFGDFFEDMITGGKKHLALLNLSIG